jgi:hypothetical protein
MASLLQDHPSTCSTTEEPPRHWRLLAVRKAGAAIDGDLRFRSAAFRSILARRRELSSTREELREQLIELLHSLVPAAPGRAARRELLDCKRTVFNRRSISTIPAWLPPETSAVLARYSEVLRREDALFERTEPVVRAEMQEWAAVLLADPVYTSACRYASAGLREEMERGSARTVADLWSRHLGLHAYASRFVSKANPLHLFATLLFPAGSGVPSGEEAEVIVDAAVLLTLEARLLAARPAPSRVWLHLAPLEDTGERLRFWVRTAGGGLRTIALNAAPPLRVLLEWFRERRMRTGKPTGIRAECEGYLRERLAPVDGASVTAFVDGLIERGGLVPYLATDLDRFGPAFLGIEPNLDPTIEVMQRHHLAGTSVAALAGIQHEIGRAANRAELPASYFVNRYDGGDPAAHGAATEAVVGPLRELAPCFAIDNNFTARSERISRVLHHVATVEDRRSVGCLELARRLLREPAVAEDPATTGRLPSAWRSEAAAVEGTLSRERLHRLLTLAASPTQPPPLCFNGTLDYLEPRYHISNVFAGGGRFAARYRLRRRTESETPAAAPVLDVEVAVPPVPNINYVVRRYAAGCGFEARYAHRYERWIEPEEVVLDLTGTTFRYRHRDTDETLRFHYRGFLLAQFLPAEYQVLLLGHADVYHNPFLRPAELAEGEALRHEPGATYGPVVLRRPRWLVRQQLLLRAAAGRDPLRRAASLSGWLHDTFHGVATEWYYRVPATHPHGHKPRFLDLLDPLGVAALCRVAQRASADSVFSFSVMDPPVSHLYRDAAGARVTELMIEI